VIFGQLDAAPEAKRYYAELVTAAKFTSTVAWGAVDPAAFDGLLLPGGHARGCGNTLTRRCCVTRAR
jgi:hypothetical protein